MNLELLTKNVVDIAIEAGLFLKEQRKQFRINEVVEKNNYDYVSYVDRETEIKIIGKLSDLLPEAGFITEEGQGHYNNETYCWIIDPLDGTTNFIHDYNPYCVSIALQKKEEILLGVVCEVCCNECFWSWQGGGAYMNGQKIATSSTTEINKAFLGLGLPYNYSQYKPFIHPLFAKFYGTTSGIRISGSAAANLCYVAAGKYDFWFEAFIKPWDFAAGALIVKEAGGMVSGFNGCMDFMKGHHIVASSNVHLHQKILEILADSDSLPMKPA
ncbi:inositol monophosphatase [Bacteroidia bacterium]|nr:inositol monophosphatase [Bacteroidia bacterium]